LDDGVELWIEALTIAPDSELVGQTVGEADIRRRVGISIVTLTSGAEGKAILPDVDTVMHAGDQLIVLGTREQLSMLQAIAKCELPHQH